jgi:hypothetical protein
MEEPPAPILRYEKPATTPGLDKSVWPKQSFWERVRDTPSWPDLIKQLALTFVLLAAFSFLRHAVARRDGQN